MPTNPVSHDHIAIAIPVFNEGRYVEDILRAVGKYAQDIIVIDDGSCDDTNSLLKKFSSIKIITHPTNQGYGQSLIDAFALAQKEGFAWIITMDCDHQHQPEYIPRFYQEIYNDNADIISGSRYLHNDTNPIGQPPPERVAINQQITQFLKNTVGLELTDSFCGFKAYKVSALRKLRLTEKGYALPLQLWIQAARTGFRIREIPVPLIYHDPQRNFNHLLANPQYRLHYYLEVLNKELGQR